MIVGAIGLVAFLTVFGPRRTNAAVVERDRVVDRETY
jgi:hypothetical protein